MLLGAIPSCLFVILSGPDVLFALKSPAVFFGVLSFSRLFMFCTFRSLLVDSIWSVCVVEGVIFLSLLLQ